MENKSERKTLTIPEVAATLGISLRSAYYLARRTDFPSFHISPNRVIVSAEGLDKWIQSQVDGEKNNPQHTS